MICERCQSDYNGSRCSCGYTPPKALEGPTNDLRSVVSKRTGIRYYLCTWRQGCNMPCTTMADVAGSILCRWHERCRDAPDQAMNQEACASWLERMQEAYPSKGWWGAPLALIWPVLMGSNPMTDTPVQTPARLSSGYMTREEFGEDLYEAIKTAAAHQQAVANVQMYKRHGKAELADEETNAAARLHGQLQHILAKQTIPPNDVREILRRYPS